ncbi:ATP-binding protein [Salipaludibacillus neizhouensis]|nr:ATP-binding protein [Salipaludibacillus neizhouensis]
MKEKVPSSAIEQGGSEEIECEECNDFMGFIIKNAEGYEFWHDCECVERKRTERIMKNSAITKEFAKLGFQNFDTTDKDSQIKDMYQCAMSYLKEFKDIREDRGNSIALLGQSGAGKTHILMAVSNNLMRKNVSVLYFPYVEGFSDLKDDFQKLEAKIHRMKKVDVLFVDDLFKPVKGTPRATEWQLEQMYSVINHRYLNHMPVLISSELIIDDMFELDEALASRIYEMCKKFIVVVKGDRKKLNHRLRGLS